jgi:hypothetical protein
MFWKVAALGELLDQAWGIQYDTPMRVCKMNRTFPRATRNKLKEESTCTCTENEGLCSQRSRHGGDDMARATTPFYGASN